MSTFEEQLVAEYFKHFITNNLNLGQYKSELWCKCGDKLIVDGHAQDWRSITEEVFYRHVADKQAAAHQSELDLAVKEAHNTVLNELHAEVNKLKGRRYTPSRITMVAKMDVEACLEVVAERLEKLTKEQL